ncbi:hypothetical protein FZEAL_10668, partial [Fusarium zealandicum]
GAGPGAAAQWGTPDPELVDGAGMRRDWLLPGAPILATGGVGKGVHGCHFTHALLLNRRLPWAHGAPVTHAGPPPKWTDQTLGLNPTDAQRPLTE